MFQNRNFQTTKSEFQFLPVSNQVESLISSAIHVRHPNHNFNFQSSDFSHNSVLSLCACFNSILLVTRNSLALRTTGHQMNLFALRKYKSPRNPFVLETQSQFAWLMQRQFTLHLHFVFNRNECAQPECGVFFTTSPPHARCLTLTLAPDGAGPGCSRIRECRGQQPFRYPRVRRARHHARTL